MRIGQTAKIPIITYHSIDESGSVISTAPDVFRQQMKRLSEIGYTVVSLSNLVKSLTDRKKLSPKTVALTFDDGFQNFYTTAFPILEQYDFKATVFLVTDYCGKYNDWAGNPAKLPRSELLSWREIRELHGRGIELGAHTRTHPDLTRISAAQAESEAADSKSIIEDKIGGEVKTFAYPYGKFNQSVKRAAEKTFSAACSVKLGKARRESDLFALERIDSYYLSNRRVFDLLSTQTFDGYLRFRQVLRDVKRLIL